MARSIAIRFTKTPTRRFTALRKLVATATAFSMGKDLPAGSFAKERRIFSGCAGAALYRRAFLDRIGLFDEVHFAYLEDVDLGYRSLLAGYENWYIPEAVVHHAGSAASGSSPFSRATDARVRRFGR